MSVYRQLCIATLASLSVMAHAASVSVDGETLVIGGFMTIDDERAFFEPFETHAIRTVRFDNCIGGRYGPQQTLQTLIERRALATEARGYVASACAITFMAGFPRRFLADGHKTELVFHAPYQAKTDALSPELSGRFRQYLIQRSGGLISPSVAALMISSTDRQAVFRVFLDAAMFQGEPVQTIYCESAESGALTCDAMSRLDAANLGLTTTETVISERGDR